MPVVEAVPTVVRDLEQHLLERLGRDHLAARRDDEPFELAEKAARVAVGRNDDRPRVSVVHRLHACVLVDLDARLGCASRETPNEPSRLQDAVGRMEERRRIASCKRRREILTPLGCESGSDERLVLLAQLVALLLVGREAKASRRAQRVARERAERVELVLRPAPNGSSGVGADRIDENRVRRGATSQREATVPPARATRNLARVEQSHRHAGFGERECARAARDPSPDDSDVDLAVEDCRGQRIGRLGEPVRRRLHWQAILEA